MALTPNEFLLLLIALGGGFLIGLMISGRGKYERLWREEQIAHRQAVRERDARMPAAALPSREADVAGARNDLTRISTISERDEAALNEAGYARYGQIAALNEEQQGALERRLGRQPGTIAREEWPLQARLLDSGKVREHERRYRGG
ncbi:hypothetical protein [Sphingobium mellinum]|uniref:hypothetical protein n=1 Tax=Sphingobium mellinum TaxID=1387166 RepID=UPI0030ED62F1